MIFILIFKKIFLKLYFHYCNEYIFNIFLTSIFIKINISLLFCIQTSKLNHFNLKRLIIISGTFKLKKKDLVAEGYNPNIIGDKVYYLNEKSGYQLLTAEIYKQIQQGNIRL